MKILTKNNQEKLFKEMLDAKLEEDCYSLDFNIPQYINSHLKRYLEDATGVIKLDYHKFEYKGKTYTQKEMIDRLITITDILIDESTYFSYSELVYDLVNEMYDILKLIHFSLWW